MTKSLLKKAKSFNKLTI